MDINEHDLVSAFKKNHPTYLRKIHLYLNQNYYQIIYNQDNQSIYNDQALCKLKYIENVWIEHEKSDCLNRYDCYRKIRSSADVEKKLREHPVYQHQIFDYLRDKASLEEIKYFVANDAVLNLEFFDYLALSIVGVSEPIRLEIIQNLWDEAGRGSLQSFHTVQFRKILSDLGVAYDREKMIASMSWEGIAGINLFSYLSLYSSNRMMYFGLLAATEMLDPPHYRELLNGISRSSVKEINATYYKEHEAGDDPEDEKKDAVQADGWMNNIILPTLFKKPAKISEFWLGFYLRLDSVQRYYDNLLHHFLNQKAA